LSDSRSSKHSGPGGESGAARLAGFIYGGVSAAVAIIFWLVTSFAGTYPAVARYGGTAWVFILMMIVLMPIVIPRVRNRRRQKGIPVIQPDPEERSPAT